MFHYTAENKQKLIKSLSGERLSTYLKAKNNDLEKALELYIKNIEISAAFLVPLQGLEVSLRNSLNETIKDHYQTEDWFNQIPLNDGAQKIIRKVKASVKKHQSNSANIPYNCGIAVWVLAGLAQQRISPNIVDSISAQKLSKCWKAKSKNPRPS